jgi:hypothetical protein
VDDFDALVQDPAAVSASELLRRTLRVDGAHRADRPNADLRGATPPQRARPIFGALQPAAAHRALQLRPPRSESPVPEPIRAARSGVDRSSAA